jgi:hypothetical protein
LRGKLLSLLKKTYPDGVDEKTVVSIFYQYHRTEDIYASLEYLACKKYIERKEQPHLYLEQEKLKWYKLTALGIDLIEGSIPDDPGVVVQRG